MHQSGFNASPLKWIIPSSNTSIHLSPCCSINHLFSLFLHLELFKLNLTHSRYIHLSILLLITLYLSSSYQSATISHLLATSWQSSFSIHNGAFRTHTYVHREQQMYNPARHLVTQPTRQTTAWGYSDDHICLSLFSLLSSSVPSHIKLCMLLREGTQQGTN